MKFLTGLIFSAFISTASAYPVTFFDTITDGQLHYDATVNAAGGTTDTLTLSGLTSGNFWDLGDFSVAVDNGANVSIAAAGVDSLTGQSFEGNGGSISSGLTFTFDTAINGFGFELGDWGTCCYPSSVYLSFDGGASQLVGTMTSSTDNPNYPNSGYFGDGIFIGAIDDTSTFTSVTFTANQGGDWFEAGGTIYSSSVGLNTVTTQPNPSAVPEPTSLALLGLGLAGFGFSRKKKKA